MNLGINPKQQHNYRFQSNTSEDDFQKLMNICNSYGLNEQETNQLIEEFKKGSLFSAERSFDDSLNESQHEMEEKQKEHEQQYSFKHQKQSFGEEQIHHPNNESFQQYQNSDRIPEKSARSMKEEPNVSFQQLEKMLTQKITIQKSLVKNLQDDNSRLKTQVQEKEKQINRLTQMKCQDTEIILGLKDIISNLTIALKEKEASFKDIQEKYTSMMENRVKELSSKRSLTQISETELQDMTNNFQNSMRDSSCNKKSVKNMKESKDQSKQIRQDNGYDKKRGNRIDVKKYKEMIQNLRNNCG